MHTPLIDKVVEQLEQLPTESQQRVLEFVQSLAVTTPRGVPGKEFIKFAGLIPEDDLALIEDAIEAGCEQINWDEWYHSSGY